MWRRIFLILGAIGFLLFLVFPLLWGIGAHIIGASLASDEPPPPIEVPEPPRAGDNQLTYLLAIAASVEWDPDGECPRDAIDQQKLGACVEVLNDHADTLSRFLAWAEEPGAMGPRQLETLGRHARSPIPTSIAANLPSLLPAIPLADLAVIAAGAAYAEEREVESERLVRAVFDLGRFFEQNPATLMHEMVGVSLTDRAVDAAVSVVPPERAGAFAVWLPSTDERLRSLRLALGSEWSTMVHFLEEEMESTAGPFDDADGESAESDDEVLISWEAVRRLGLYDPAHTRQMHDRFWAAAQASVRELPLLGRQIALEHWDAMGAVKYFHNPVGRLMHSLAMPNHLSFGTRVARSIDRVAALRVVLAARAYFHANRHWPESEAELVPAFLPFWPASALSGAPLPWESASGTVFLFDEEDGKTICRGRDCSFSWK